MHSGNEVEFEWSWIAGAQFAYLHQVQYVCKDHRDKKEVPDPIMKDLISDKI